LGAYRGVGCFVTGIEKLHKEKLGRIWVHKEKSGVLLLGLKYCMKRKLGLKIKTMVCSFGASAN
jgi:coenzyme F420-reducing hydrogenase beta subunit